MDKVFKAQNWRINARRSCPKIQCCRVELALLADICGWPMSGMAVFTI
jgi:hypothetical protein